MFVVDTNILVYAANRDAAEHLTCKRLVESWCNQSGIWHVTWGILYEFVRVVTHPRVFPSPWLSGRAWSFVETLLLSAGLVVLKETELHAKVGAELLFDVRKAYFSLQLEDLIFQGINICFCGCIIRSFCMQSIRHT